MVEKLEEICKHALDREKFSVDTKCYNCNLKMYKEKITCFEPEKWEFCYFYFNWRNRKGSGKYE